MYYLPIYLHIKMQIYNFAVLTIKTHTLWKILNLRHL